jgi:hypothetical protein
MPEKTDGGDSEETPGAAPEAPSQAQRSTHWVLPLVTAAVLITVFCLYYFVYVKAQREYLGSRNFRALAALGDQLQKQITIHGSILEFYADVADARRHQSDSQLQKVDFNRQILVVRPEDKELPPKEQGQEAQRDYMKFLAPALELADPTTTASSKHTDKKSSSKTAPDKRIATVHRNGQWIVELSAQQDAGSDTNYGGSLVLEDLFRSLVEPLPFDEVLLASDHGEIVYQSRKDGPRFMTLSDLLKNQTGTEKKPIADKEAATENSSDGDPASPASKADAVSIHLTDVVLTGTSYKLFLQPVLLDAFSDDPGQPVEKHEWVICGLRSSAALEWEAMAISYTAIIWFTVLFFAICIGAPILKVFLMNQRERLRVREFGFLALFLVLLSGVFTLSGLQAAYFFYNDDHQDGQLLQLGKDLSSNIHLELGLMRDELLAMCHTTALQHDLKRAAPKIGSGKTAEVTRQRIADYNLDRTLWPDSTKSTLDQDSADVWSAATKYRNFNFNNAFWTDDEGHQVVKWNPGDYVTPFVNVSSLPSFTEPKTSYLDGHGPLRVDSVLPPNRIEYLAAVSMNTKDCNPTLGSSVRADIANGQAFLTAQPFSLIDPVLPFGYGFALVDQNGVVLFHSDKTKNTRENFLQESEWNKELSAAVFGHSSERSLTIKYLGKDYRAVVVPIPGLDQAPLSLIVYRDLTLARTLDLQSMSMSSTLFLLLLSGPALCIAVWFLISRPRVVPEWVWPNPARTAAYVYLIALYVVLIVSFLFLGFSASSEEAVIACVAIPYAALLLTSWAFQVFPAVGKDRMMRRRNLLLPAVLWGMATILFLTALGFQRPYLKAFALLLGVGGIATVPLLPRARVYMLRRFKHRYRLGGTFRKNSRLQGRELFGYQTCYALTFLLLLLLIGVLTPMALFRASMSVERRLQTKQAQLHLASALEQHQQAIDEEHETSGRSDFSYGEFFRDSSQWTLMKFKPMFWPDNKVSLQEHGEFRSVGTDNEITSYPHLREFEIKEGYSNWFQSLIYALHHDYNAEATETLGVISDRPGAGQDWTWQELGQSSMLVWRGARPMAGKSDPPQKEYDLVIDSVVPDFSSGDTWTAVEIGVGVMIVIGAIFWALMRRLFLLEIAPLKLDGHAQIAECLREGRNVLILLPPVSDWQWEEPTWKMDVAQLAAGPKWAEHLDLETVPHHTLIEIRNFEHMTGNTEIDDEKVLLLERLSHRKDTQFVALMSVNASSQDYRRQFPFLSVIDLREEPFQWRAAYEGPARDLIWKECCPLPALWPIGAQLARDIRTEAIHSEGAIASEILERAGPYYRMIWHECSAEQKFVLAHLAMDGLLNPTNDQAVRQLMRRGLIVKDPQFRVVNESFRLFLLSAATAKLKREWLRESHLSGWGRAQGAVFTTVILVGAFLLTTQNDLLQSSAGYVTAALGAFGTFAKLFNMIRGSVPGDKSS